MRNDISERLPQLRGGQFLTDSGLETTFIFHDGIELPHFASFTLLDSPAGSARVRAYYARHLDIAAENGMGFILEAPTWRANPDWGAKLGYSAEDLERVNRDAIALMRELKQSYAGRVAPIVTGGNIGPRGDGYVPGDVMTPAAAEAYHRAQVAAFAKAGADMVSAFTLSYAGEAIGIVRAAEAQDMPCVISFTLETDGRLPTGQPLGEAIAEVDAATDSGPAYYMINCAHPDHFTGLFTGDAWEQRIRGLRANASRRSHEELNEASDLDDGDPHELGSQYAALLKRLPHVNVLGGCCGTDHRHVAAIGRACANRHAA